MNHRAPSEVLTTSLGELNGMPKWLFMRFVVKGAVGLSLRSPPGLARSPCSQKIKFPSGESTPPFERCVSLPVGVMVSEDQIYCEILT